MPALFKKASFRYFIGYLSILTVPVIVSVAVFISFRGYFHEELEKYGFSILSQIKTGMDDKLYGVSQKSMDIVIDRRITKFSTLGTKIDAYGIETLVLAQALLDRAKVSDNYISDAFLINYNGGFVLTSSGKTDLGEHFSRHRFYQPDGGSNWESLISGWPEYGFFIISSPSEQKQYIVLARAIPVTAVRREDCKAALVMLIDVDIIRAEFVRLSSLDQSGLYLVNSQGDAVIGVGIGASVSAVAIVGDNSAVAGAFAGGGYGGSAFDGVADWEPGLFNPEGASGVYKPSPDIILCYAASDFSPWLYVWLNSIDSISANLALIEALMAYSLLAATALGLVISIYLTRNNLSPVTEIIRLIRRQPEAGRHQSTTEEFVDIRRGISILMQSHQAMEGELERARLRLVELTKHSDAEMGNIRYSQIEQYIREHYYEINLSLEQVASAFGISPPYLSSLFKSMHGESFLIYLRHVRIGKAKELLKTGKTLEQIASNVGYINANILIRNFKKDVGMTPGQYRMQVPYIPDQASDAPASPQL
ncbi:MAG: helix-turn-helix domain-containing protein [Oscillospiraceae bacterium]|nr:helix-turn-helix domain-containing protein [Oscillospiraceae bacterium]